MKWMWWGPSREQQLTNALSIGKEFKNFSTLWIWTHTHFSKYCHFSSPTMYTTLMLLFTKFSTPFSFSNPSNTSYEVLVSSNDFKVMILFWEVILVKKSSSKFRQLTFVKLFSIGGDNLRKSWLSACLIHDLLFFSWHFSHPQSFQVDAAGCCRNHPLTLTTMLSAIAALLFLVC